MSEEFTGERPCIRGGANAVFRLGPADGELFQGTRGGFRLRRRRLAMSGGQVMIKEPLTDAEVPLIAREMEVTCTLQSRYGPDQVPRQLARVLARDAVNDPPRLLLDCRGDCLGDWTEPDALHRDGALQRAIRDLFTAVAALHECGLVHGRISPEHLWWDNSGLQLAGLDRVVGAGERAHDRPLTRWDPAGHATGRPARAQDDVYSAGLVAFWLATGEYLPLGAGQEEIRSRLELHDVWIGDLLRYVFPAAGSTGHPGALPSAAAVLLRLTPAADRGWVRRISDAHRQRLADADEEFTRLRERQANFRARARAERRAAAGPGASPPQTDGSAAGAAAPARTPWTDLWRRLFGRRAGDDGAPPFPPPGVPRTPTRAPRRVECPVCLTALDWDDLPRTIDDGSGTLVPRDPNLPGRGPAASAAEEARSYRTCPGNSAVGAHNLPERYPSFGTEPVRIGLVGSSRTGKTHLLAAMIHQMTDAGAMARYGLTVEGLDLRQFTDYCRTVVDPLIGDRRELQGTLVTAELHFAAGLVVTDRATGRHHSVVFFDVAGERLERTGPEADFINRLGGLLCVVDPVRVRGLARLGRDAEQGPSGDAAVRAVLQRLKENRPLRGEEFLRLPCALVISKSDLLRHRGYEEVEPWLPGGDAGGLDVIEQESRAVFGMLRARGGDRWLDPVLECENATLHLASATGTAPNERVDADGVRRFPAASFGQHRVVEPLISLMIMKGVLTPPPDPARAGRGW